MDETGKPTQHTAHIEAFCDGVFAIAATLLVLEVRVPGHDAVTAAGGLWRALGQHWSSYAAYALSFVVIGIMGRITTTSLATSDAPTTPS